MERKKDSGGPSGSNNPDVKQSPNKADIETPTVTSSKEKHEQEKSEMGVSNDKESNDTQSMTSLDRQNLRKALRSQNTEYSYAQDNIYKENLIKLVQDKKEITDEKPTKIPSVTSKKPLPRTWPYDPREDSVEEEFKKELREKEKNRQKCENRKEKVKIKKEEIRKHDHIFIKETREERTTPYVDWRLREQGLRGLRPERVKSTTLVHPVTSKVTWPWLRDWGMEPSCADVHSWNCEREPRKSVSREGKVDSRLHESKPLPESKSKSHQDKTKEVYKLKPLHDKLEEQVKSKPFQKTIEKRDQSKSFHGRIEEQAHSKPLKEHKPKDEDALKIVQEMIKDEDTLKAIQKIIKEHEKFRNIYEMLKDEDKLKIIQEMVKEQDKLNAIRSRSAKKEDEKIKLFYRMFQDTDKLKAPYDKSRKPSPPKKSGRQPSAKSRERKKKTEDNLQEEK